VKFQNHEEDLIKIQSFQNRKLLLMLKYVNKNSLFYRELFAKNRIDFRDINIESLSLLPFTTRNDLQERNADFICVPPSKICEVVTTSGTTGESIFLSLTQKDLKRLARNEAKAMHIAGVDKDALVQMAVTSDRCFMAGLAYMTGLHKLRATLLRVGPGSLPMHFEMFRKMRPDTLIAVPSFVLKMIEFSEENNLKEIISIRKIICIGENIRNSDFTFNSLALKILEYLPHVKLFSTYASTEMAAAFTECLEGKGGHHLPEMGIVELVDEAGNPVPSGKEGEVIFTHLGVKGMPLIRYKTGDISTWYKEPCACGRTTLRVGPIQGRLQQKIKYKGTTLFPSSIDLIFAKHFPFTEYITEAYTTKNGIDGLRIFINLSTFEQSRLESLIAFLQMQLRVLPPVFFKTSEEFNLSFPQKINRKPIRFIDRRVHMNDS